MATRTINRWLISLSYIESRRSQASLCMLFKIIHVLCFLSAKHVFHKVEPQPTYILIPVGSSCSNSHLHILMHINTNSYQILFMCGACFQHFKSTLPVIVTYLKISYCVYAIIPTLFYAFY